MVAARHRLRFLRPTPLALGWARVSLVSLVGTAGTVGAAGVGCSADIVRLEPLVPPVDAASVIFAYRDGSTLVIEARPISATPILWSRENVAPGSGASVTALFYRRTLADLAIRPGTLLPTSGGNTRGLPDFDAGVIGQIDAPSAGWTAISVLDEVLSRFRFERVDRVLYCADVSGCLDAPAEDATCLDPCPTPPSPMAPALPSPPDFGECPPGWRQDSAGACDPWPATGHGVCAQRATHHLPGTAGCLPVGRACDEASEWPRDLPSSSTRTIAYVRAGASPTGDGSQANPFPSIGAALAAVPAGALVAVAKGEYDEALRLDRDVEIRGACAAETVIRAVGTDVVRIEGVNGSVVGVKIEDLSLEGKGSGLVAEGSTGSSLTVTLRGVSVERPTGYGIRLAGATADVEDVRILGAGSTSLMVESTRAEIRNLSISEGQGQGIEVATSSVSIERLLVEDVIGSGLRAGPGARLHLRELFVSETDSWSFASGTFVVEDARIVRSSPYTEMTVAWASLTLNRVSLSGVSIYAASSAQLEATDVALDSGRGIGIDGRATLDRVAIRNTLESGVSLGDIADVLASDLEIDMVSPPSSIVGVRTKDGSQVSGARWKIAMRSGVAAYLRDQSHLTDVTLEGKSADPLDLAVSGITVYGRATIERVNVRRIGGPALLALETSEVTVRDFDVAGGRGAVLARNGAQLELERFHISDVQGPALTIDPFKDDTFGTTRIFAQDGSIEGCQIGAQLPARERVVDVFERVQYAGNQTIFFAP
ncbi:MAG: DUF1565 domain-containing protein [Deltaproteobacteria bacterium]|nr:DUF1565 domain-containing protein [Deltaproteobacteria bacterium]